MSVATTRANLEARNAALEAALAAERAKVETLTKERDQLRASHDRLRFELELLKRRIFIAKAERVDTEQLELEFAAKLRELDNLAGTLGMPGDEQGDADADDDNDGDDPKRKGKKKSSGRRNLRALAVEEERIEAPDPIYEQLVAEGKAKRMGFEDTVKLGWKRGGLRRVVYARVKYQVTDDEGQTAVDVAEMPKETFPRLLAAPSLIAHILMEKYGKGLPLYRIEDGFGRDGIPIDRGTMCRWVEDAGGTAGATVIAAAKKEAIETAFCIATDATGVLVQPIANDKGGRTSCRRGHYFVQIADRDHVFFEYTPKETSKAVRAMFRGYDGYVQADAKSVYDALYREPGKDDHPDDKVCKEVACWTHCRRNFWESALAKKALGREGLVRIGRIFDLDASWKDKPPGEIKRLRGLHLRPHLEAFFAWAEAEYESVREERGILRSAFGYAVRHKAALMRVLDDGRLLLDNNRSERELRRIATGRKAWLFAGSDDHAQSAGHILSLIASARLHGLDPEAYLRDLFRVLAHWPRERYLELAPKYWAATRARLDARQLADEIGSLTIPPPLTATPEEQAAPDAP
jgi:transposase